MSTLPTEELLQRMQAARERLMEGVNVLVKAAEALGEPPRAPVRLTTATDDDFSRTRYPCSPTCTHDDAATPSHPERVRAKSEAVTISLASASHRQVTPNGRCRHNERWAECAACDGYEEGAEAMRAACWEAVQAVLQREGVHPTSTPWITLKAAIEGATP